MKSSFSHFLMILILLSPIANAQEIYTGGNDLQFTISGTSNVHDWEESVSKMTGTGKIVANGDGTITVQSLDVTIQTEAIKSTHGSIMDNKTYDALKAEKNPTITFKLTAPLNNIKIGSTVTAKGDLKVAGITKPIDLNVKVNGTGDALQFEGTKNISMKDFGITPPTAFMGAMKVGETVTLKFKTTYKK